MAEKILDIWAIQDHPEEIYDALANITHDVVIFKNVISKLKILGKRACSCAYDTIIYSEGSDTLIILKRNGKATAKQAEEYFDSKGIEYHVVDFVYTEQETQDGVKEFWFARDKYVIDDAVANSVKNNNTSCKYSPEVKSHLFFKYPVYKYLNDSPILNARQHDKEILFSISFRGLIEFDDKFILPTLGDNQRNLHFKDVKTILDKYKIDVTIDENLENFSI